MPEYNVDDIVNLIVSGDKATLSTAVNSVLMQKAADAIEVEKVMVAQKYFNGQDFGDDEESEEPEDTQEVETETDTEEPEAETEDREATVPERHGHHGHPAHDEGAGDLVRHELRDAAADVTLPVEHIGELPADRGPRLGVGVARDRPGLERVELPQVVEAQDVVGVRVGEEHGVHAVDRVAEHLLTQVGGCVHQQARLPRHVHHDGGPQTRVARIRGAAHGAATPDHRHPVRGAGAEHRDPGRAGQGMMMRDSGLPASTNRIRSS